MTDLMQALFQYAQEHRVMEYLDRDSEYRNALRCSEKQRLLLQDSLTPQQTAHLDSLLSERDLVCFAQLQAIFQAAFSMALELSR